MFRFTRACILHHARNDRPTVRPSVYPSWNLYLEIHVKGARSPFSVAPRRLATTRRTPVHPGQRGHGNPRGKTREFAADTNVPSTGTLPPLSLNRSPSGNITAAHRDASVRLFRWKTRRPRARASHISLHLDRRLRGLRPREHGGGEEARCRKSGGGCGRRHSGR